MAGIHVGEVTRLAGSNPVTSASTAENPARGGLRAGFFFGAMALTPPGRPPAIVDMHSRGTDRQVCHTDSSRAGSTGASGLHEEERAIGCRDDSSDPIQLPLPLIDRVVAARRHDVDTITGCDVSARASPVTSRRVILSSPTQSTDVSLDKTVTWVSGSARGCSAGAPVAVRPARAPTLARTAGRLREWTGGVPRCHSPSHRPGSSARRRSVESGPPFAGHRTNRHPPPQETHPP